MAQTQETYYSNKNNFGKYQYVAFSQIVLSLEQDAQEDGNYMSGIKRSKILKHAKQGLRDLTADVANENLSFEVTVPESLVWALPQDYVSDINIFLVEKDSCTGNFDLFPLEENPNMSSAIGYLQDHNTNPLYDDDGDILLADSLNAINHPSKLNTKQNRYGGFVVDERRGVIVFTSNIADKEVVIRYKSDGLQAQLKEEEVYLHKHIKEALTQYTYYHCIKDLRSTLVPANEKRRAKNEYLSTRHKAVLNRAGFTFMKIYKATNSSNTL